MTVIGTTNHVGAVTVPTPVNATDAGRKDYIDGLTYLTANTGLTKTGSALSVNASQPQITAVGTLTGLTSSGIVNITNATPATSTTSGSLIVAGGIGVTGASYFGGTGNFTNNVVIGGNTVYSSNNLFTTSSTGSTFNIFRIRSQDTTNTGVALSVGNFATTSNYTSRLALFTLNVNENSANSEQLMVDATATGGSIYWQNAGTGVARPLTVYGNTVFNTNGTVNINSTIDSNSAVTGGLVLGGGLGVAKNVFVGSNLYIGNSSASMLQDNTAGGFGFRIRNTDATNTETRFSLDNSIAASTYTSRLRLYSLATSEVANNEYLNLSAGPTGAALNWMTVGTGTARPLSIYNGAISVNATGTAVTIGASTSFSITSTVDSTSLATGALVLSGGLGVAKNITAASAAIANLTIVPFSTTASWINMPTTGPSGIGTGGAGANVWMGYASGAGNWFTNSATGDICYRNTGGKLLFGNTAGNAQMVLSGDNLGLGKSTPSAKLDVVGNVAINGILTNSNTTDSISLSTGSTILAGGLAVGKSLTVNMGIRLIDNTTKV